MENSNINMTKSTKKLFQKTFNESVENLSDEEILEKVKTSNDFIVIKEGATFKIKQVLKG